MEQTKNIEYANEHTTDATICKDYDPPTDPDGGCSTIKCPTMCWLYDISTGYCPYVQHTN